MSEFNYEQAKQEANNYSDSLSDELNIVDNRNLNRPNYSGEDYIAFNDGTSSDESENDNVQKKQNTAAGNNMENVNMETSPMYAASAMATSSCKRKTSASSETASRKIGASDRKPVAAGTSKQKYYEFDLPWQMAKMSQWSKAEVESNLKVQFQKISNGHDALSSNDGKAHAEPNDTRYRVRRVVKGAKGKFTYSEANRRNKSLSSDSSSCDASSDESTLTVNLVEQFSSDSNELSSSSDELSICSEGNEGNTVSSHAEPASNQPSSTHTTQHTHNTVSQPSQMDELQRSLIQTKTLKSSNDCQSLKRLHDASGCPSEATDAAALLGSPNKRKSEAYLIRIPHNAIVKNVSRKLSKVPNLKDSDDSDGTLIRKSVTSKINTTYAKRNIFAHQGQGQESTDSSSSSSSSSTSTNGFMRERKLELRLKSKKNYQECWKQFRHVQRAQHTQIVDQRKIMDMRTRVDDEASKGLGKRKRKCRTGSTSTSKVSARHPQQAPDVPIDTANEIGIEDTKLDFYEDEVFKGPDSTYLLPQLLSPDFREIFYAICQLTERASNQFKYEFLLLRYPVFVLCYFNMVTSFMPVLANSFWESSYRYFDDLHITRLGRLRLIKMAADVPIKARQLIAGMLQVPVSMSEQAHRQLMLSIELWSVQHREWLLKHLHFKTFNDYGVPRHRRSQAVGPLPIIFYAVPDATPKKDAQIVVPRRGRRPRNNVPPEIINKHLPTDDRIYFHEPKRMEQLRRKNDERHCLQLNREHLPSVHMYTAFECTASVTCACFSNNITMLCLGTSTSLIYVYSLTKSKLVELMSADALHSTNSGKASVDKLMFDPVKKTMRRTLYGHSGVVYNCAFSSGDRFLLSCSIDSTVRLWCLLTWSCVVIYPGHLSPVFGLCFSPSGYYFATGGDDGTARIWSMDSQRPVHVLCGHVAEVSCCLFHPNMHYLATGSGDCNVRMWDFLQATMVRLFTGHKGTVNALTFSRCGRYLVSGSADKLVIVWDTPKEQLVRYIEHHAGPIYTIEVSMGNNLLLVGGQDCRLSMWDFQGLLHDYATHKLRNNRSSDSAGVELPTKDLLLRSYLTKNASLIKLHVTRRNLVLAFSSHTMEHEKQEQWEQQLKKMKTDEGAFWSEYQRQQSSQN